MVFVLSIMAVCLFVFVGIFLILGTMHNSVLDCELYSSPVYLGIGAVILTVADLSLLLGSLTYIAIAIIMRGQNFDASSRHCFKIQLVSPMLYF